MSKKEEKETKNTQNQHKKEVSEKTLEKEKNNQEEPDNNNPDNNEQDLKKLKEKIENLEKNNLLLLAELDNRQKQFRKQMEEVYKYSNKKLIQWILDFLIDLEERALKAMHSDQEKKVQKHLVGIEMMRNNLWKSLENEGVKEMEVKVKSDVWNSYLHELVEEVLEEKLPEGTITEVSEKGYLLHGQVLRPAKVKISKKNK